MTSIGLFCPYSPTVNANHDHAGKVETDTAGDDSIRGRQIQSACGVLLAIILENQRLVGSMDPQRDGYKRDERCQQPNSCNGNNSHPACHPSSVSAMKARESSTSIWSIGSDCDCSLRLPAAKGRQQKQELDMVAARATITRKWALL